MDFSKAIRYVLAISACCALIIVFIFIVGIIQQITGGISKLGAIPAIIFILLPFFALIYAIKKTWKAIVS